MPGTLVQKGLLYFIVLVIKRADKAVHELT